MIGILAESRLHGFDALRQSNSEHFFVGRSATILRPAQGQWRVAPVIDGSVVLFQAPPDPGNEHGDVHAVIPINERAPQIITAGMPGDLEGAILLERWLLWAGFQSNSRGGAVCVQELYMRGRMPIGERDEQRGL